MQILFVLVDLANKEVASPVVDFFMLPADKTSVILLKIMSHLSIIVDRGSTVNLRIVSTPHR